MPELTKCPNGRLSSFANHYSTGGTLDPPIAHREQPNGAITKEDWEPGKRGRSWYANASLLSARLTSSLYVRLILWVKPSGWTSYAAPRSVQSMRHGLIAPSRH